MWRLYLRRAHFNPHVPGPRFADPEDVPESLALAAVANTLGSDLMNVDGIVHAIVHLPWLARSQPEDMYFPAEVLPMVRIPFKQEFVLDLLQRHKRYEGRLLPRQAAQKPERNAPCPCGSGVKYKRCCANRADSDAVAR